MRKLIIVLPEKEPDTGHICFNGGCPFYQSGQPQGTICHALWENKPSHINNPLASLCNYYNTKDLTIMEVDGDVLDSFLSLRKEA